MYCSRYCVFRHLPKFDRRSSLLPLVERLNSQLLEFEFFYKKWDQRSWTLSHILRSFGNWYFRSTWNGLAPWVDEQRFLSQIESGASIVHFLWGEFASPRLARPYHRKGARVLGTFHCSARRLPEVLKGFDPVRKYDFITLMSETQRPFFEGQGFPPDCIRAILHGVDTEYFCPGNEARMPGERLRLLLMGDTERDHEFAAHLFSKLSPEHFEISVKTNEVNQRAYQGLDQVHMMSRLSGEELRAAYRRADLLVLPLLDCTANNAVLESMACGTPVMTNRVGGIGEYVCSNDNIVLDQKKAEDWVDLLNHMSKHREKLMKCRPLVRAWAERFDWDHIVPQYEEVYDTMMTATH